MRPETEAFLARVRDAEAPTVEAQQNVLEAVRAAVALAPSAAKTATLGLKSILKLSLCVAGVTAAASALQWPAELPSSRAPAAVNAPISRPSTPRAIQPPAPPPALRPEPSSPRLPRSRPSLQAELDFLAAVHASLRRGDGADALRRLDAHRTTDRQLLAERRAARVFALCAAGRRAAAQRAAVSFIRHHPSAPQREAVERVCAAVAGD